MSKLVVAIVWVSCSLCTAGWCQPSSAAAARSASKDKSTPATSQHLTRVQTVHALSELAGVFYAPLKCDSDGNIYLTTDVAGMSGVRKLSPKGERLVIFQAQTNSDMKKIDMSKDFSVGPFGEFYELVFPHEIDRYVFVYKADGSYKSAIKLDPGFPWRPTALAVFPSGNLLVSGLEYDRDRKNPVMWPFTGIFSPSGSPLKELKLKDDEALRDLAASGDTRVTSPTNPSTNRAIEFTNMETGADGNVYMMRWTNPALVYAISPGGEIRRFTVNPGDSSYSPVSMHVAGNRIAVLFIDPQSTRNVMQIVDLEGRKIATYEEQVEGKAKTDLLGNAFACYAQNPERFTFLETDDNNKLEFLIAEPR